MHALSVLRLLLCKEILRSGLVPDLVELALLHAGEEINVELASGASLLRSFQFEGLLLLGLRLGAVNLLIVLVRHGTVLRNRLQVAVALRLGLHLELLVNLAEAIVVRRIRLRLSKVRPVPASMPSTPAKSSQRRQSSALGRPCNKVWRARSAGARSAFGPSTSAGLQTG